MKHTPAASKGISKDPLAGCRFGRVYGYVYKVVNLRNRVLNFYIGQKKAEAFYPVYFGSGKKILRSIKKFGSKNFSIRVLAWAWSKIELDFLETRAISDYRFKFGRRRLYNIAKGGGSGPKSKKTRIMLSRSNKGQVPWSKGKKLSKRHKAALSAASMGHKLSRAGCNKIRKALLGNTNHLGMKCSMSSRKKMSIVKLGVKWTKERRAAALGRIPWNKGLSQKTHALRGN